MSLDGIDTWDIARIVTANVIANELDSTRFHERAAAKLSELGFDDRHVRLVIYGAIDALFEGFDHREKYRVRMYYNL